MRTRLCVNLYLGRKCRLKRFSRLRQTMNVEDKSCEDYVNEKPWKQEATIGFVVTKELRQTMNVEENFGDP